MKPQHKNFDALSFLKHKKERSIDLAQVRKEISETSKETSIYVGGDSKVFRKYGKEWVAYVSCIIIHFDSNRGGKVFKQINIDRYYGSIRQRLMQEVYYVGDIASKIADIVNTRPFEIHIDINADPKHISNTCVKEATGFILGSLGITPKIKPHAFAASTISDKYAVKNAC